MGLFRFVRPNVRVYQAPKGNPKGTPQGEVGFLRVRLPGRQQRVAPTGGPRVEEVHGAHALRVGAFARDWQCDVLPSVRLGQLVAGRLA